MTGYNLPPGTTPAMIDAQCGADEYEIDDDVIRDAVDLATEEINEEYLGNIHDVIKVALTPLLEAAIAKRVDEYLENYKVEGTFK